jgi:hypothetical protein
LRTWRGPLAPIAIGIGVAAVIYAGTDLLARTTGAEPRAAATESAEAAPPRNAYPGSPAVGPRPSPPARAPAPGAADGRPAVGAPAFARVTPTPASAVTTGTADAEHPDPPTTMPKLADPPATMPDLAEGEETEAEATPPQIPAPKGQFPYVELDVDPASPCSFPGTLGLTTDRKVVECVAAADGRHQWQLQEA